MTRPLIHKLMVIPEIDIANIAVQNRFIKGARGLLQTPGLTQRGWAEALHLPYPNSDDLNILESDLTLAKGFFQSLTNTFVFLKEKELQSCREKAILEYQKKILKI